MVDLPRCVYAFIQAKAGHDDTGAPLLAAPVAQSDLRTWEGAA